MTQIGVPEVVNARKFIRQLIPGTIVWRSIALEINSETDEGIAKLSQSKIIPGKLPGTFGIKLNPKRTTMMAPINLLAFRVT